MSTLDRAFDDIDDFDAPDDRPVAYRSPVMSRLSGSGKLTLETLRRDVPRFQAGRAAAERLTSDDPLTDDEREALQTQVYLGDQAKERLVLAGIPLIKHLATKEHTRRQNWNSQVTFDDLFQEGVSGLIRGLMAYNVDGGQKSATNYLGQWIMVEMRRNVEAVDNDFGVAFDAAERFRKIRALRSRLSSELGREPTDEEIIAASNDPMFRGGNKMGRVNKSATPNPRRQLTMAQLAEERTMRNRVGHTARFASGGDSDEYEGPQMDAGRPLHVPDTTVDAALDVVEQGAREGLARLLQQTLDAMRLPSVQRDVIARRYGLPPHEKEESGRDIGRALNLHRERVGRVIEAFTEEMSRPGGAFHRVCSNIDGEALADLGLGWVTSALGPWDRVPAAAKEQPVPEALVMTLTPRTGTVPPPPEQPASHRGPQVRAQFVCDYHGWGFVGVYARRDDVPKERACPQCGRPSGLSRLLAA